jgi:hypothetical protein
MDVQPSQEWTNLLASEHGATTCTLDFAGDASRSRDAINRWVGEQTQGLNPDGPTFIRFPTLLVAPGERRRRLSAVAPARRGPAG